MSGGPFLYPNVTSVPKTGVEPTEKQPKKQEGVPSEFDLAFDKALGKQPAIGEKELSQIKAPLKFSAHASQRLKERKINLDAATLSKVSEAIEKAEAKGVDDTLVLTKDAALIVNVKNKTVITALDRNSLSGNVFTNIDGAVIV